MTTYLKQWNQAELEDIAQNTDFPIHEYFEQQWVPIAGMLKEVPLELTKALNVRR